MSRRKFKDSITKFNKNIKYYIYFFIFFSYIFSVLKIFKSFFEFYIYIFFLSHKTNRKMNTRQLTENKLAGASLTREREGNPHVRIERDK